MKIQKSTVKPWSVWRETQWGNLGKQILQRMFVSRNFWEVSGDDSSELSWSVSVRGSPAWLSFQSFLIFDRSTSHPPFVFQTQSSFTMSSFPRVYQFPSLSEVEEYPELTSSALLTSRSTNFFNPTPQAMPKADFIISNKTNPCSTPISSMLNLVTPTTHSNLLVVPSDRDPSMSEPGASLPPPAPEHHFGSTLLQVVPGLSVAELKKSLCDVLKGFYVDVSVDPNQPFSFACARYEARWKSFCCPYIDDRCRFDGVCFFCSFS